MRRAAISIPSNIAEGRHRGTRKNYVHFLIIAYWSSMELESQLIISRELSFGNKSEYKMVQNNLCEVCKLLNAIIEKLKS